MTSEQITTFLEGKAVPQDMLVKIGFKTRNTIFGLIIKGNDYTHLKSKNFWRIVTKPNLKKWQESKNVEFAKIFNGSDFTKLSVVSVWDEE